MAPPARGADSRSPSRRDAARGSGNSPLGLWQVHVAQGQLRRPLSRPNAMPVCVSFTTFAQRQGCWRETVRTVREADGAGVEKAWASRQRAAASASSALRFSSSLAFRSSAPGSYPWRAPAEHQCAAETCLDCGILDARTGHAALVWRWKAEVRMAEGEAWESCWSADRMHHGPWQGSLEADLQLQVVRTCYVQRCLVSPGILRPYSRASRGFAAP